DFEFFVRASQYSNFFPEPASIQVDCYCPTKNDYFKYKTYRGFRSLNQLYSAQAERFGLRAFHFWHPTNREGDWREHNDWSRERFRKVLAPYLKEPSRLLEIDGIDRPKKALCICKNAEHWGYMAPLRLHG